MEGSLTKDIGKQIRNLRTERHLTLEQLAERSEISYSYLGDIERGRRSCTTITLQKITNALGLNLHEFFSFLMPTGNESQEDLFLNKFREVPSEHYQLLLDFMVLLKRKQI
jgi:transcriptional regulator with XRE-family HTH domain